MDLRNRINTSIDGLSESMETLEVGEFSMACMDFMRL